jgi:preprotein translocase subunit SecF
MSANLTEAEMDAIAERAADRAIRRIYEQIGKSVAQKVYWAIGVAVVGMMMLLAGNGMSKP